MALMRFTQKTSRAFLQVAMIIVGAVVVVFTLIFSRFSSTSNTRSFGYFDIGPGIAHADVPVTSCGYSCGTGCSASDPSCGGSCGCGSGTGGAGDCGAGCGGTAGGGDGSGCGGGSCGAY